MKERKYGSKEFYDLLDEIGDLHESKNQDYASGAIQGPFGNFKRIAAIQGLYPDSTIWSTPMGVCLTYMLKQLDAALLLATTSKESVTGEGVEQRLSDVAVYSLLAIAMNKETLKEVINERN